MKPRVATEILESRRMMAIAVAGTTGNDLISVAADGTDVLVTVNGVQSRFAADPTGIVVNAGDGTDTIRLLDASGLNVTLSGEGGNDRIEVGGGDLRAARLKEVSVVGGSGTDTLLADDSLAATGNASVIIDNPIDTYVSIVAAPGTSIRANAATTADAVESIVYTGTAQGDLVEVRGTSTYSMLSLNGLAGDDTMRVGDDIDTDLKGAVSLDGGAGVDQLTVDDSADTFADTYFFANAGSFGTIRKDSGGSTVSYTGFGTLALNAGRAGTVAANQRFRVSSLPGTVQVSILAGAGDDLLFFGDEAGLDTLQARLNFDGEAGVDEILYSDTVGTDPAAYILGASTLTNTGTGTLGFLNTESLLLTANNAANDIRATTLGGNLTATLNGGGGNDTLRVGNGDLDLNLPNSISVVGGAGTDVLFIDDTTDNVGNDVYDIAGDAIRKGLVATFLATSTADRVETVNLLASPNADTIRINSVTRGIGLSIDAGNGNDSILINSTGDGSAAAASTVTIVSGAGTDTLDVNSDSSGADANVVLPLPVEELGNLRIRAGGTVKLTGGLDAVLAVRGTLTIAGRLDIADATVIASNGNLAALSALAATGYAGGTWTGGTTAAAIVSSTAASSSISDAVAVALASDVALPAPGGVATVAGDVLLRYTLVADANLDRVVNFTDLVMLAQAYNTLGNGWARGNFDFDAEGNTNFADLVLLAQNYNQSLGPPTVARAVSVQGKSPRMR